MELTLELPMPSNEAQGGALLAASDCYASFRLLPIKRSNETMLQYMSVHYSKPLGFVGRNICYAIMCGSVCYGTIAGGSATRFLPNREIIGGLNNGVNNIFFHLEKQHGKYPMRNFAAAVLKLYRGTIECDWKAKYGDAVEWHETLVELPRTGDCYKRDGWTLAGQTKGYTCKRTSGKGTDSWSGRRIWDTVNLRPKLVFVRRVTSDALTTHNDAAQRQRPENQKP